MKIIKATQNVDGMVTMTSADFEALVTDLDRLKRCWAKALLIGGTGQCATDIEGTVMNQTKAEQLADAVTFYDTRTEVQIDNAAAELRRLAPIEGLLVDATSKRDKLLAVNKVLVDALRMSDKYICGEGSSEVIDQVDEALKLAGEIK